MGGNPTPSEAPSAVATSTPDAGGGATAETRKDGAPKTRMGSAPASTPAAGPSAAQTKAAALTPAGAGDATGTQGTGTPTAGGTVQPPTARPRWVKPAAIVAGLLVVAAAAVLGARWLRSLEGMQQFIATYDGHASQPGSAPEGIPPWLGWQHFLNMFFIVLIIRTGLQVRTERKPPAYWTAKKNSFFAPRGNSPKKVSLSQWLHQCLDVLWVVNGLVFMGLLFATGQWMRIVPTDWDVVPNMVSAAIQYASLDWPSENGWVHYNALQVMAYFVTVFIAAPLAVLSGMRFSTWWPEKAERLNKAYPVEWARAVHFPVMLYFVAFTIVHIFLVFFTGALRNLNHMYTSRDVVDWWGLVVFLASLAAVAAAWFLTQPLFTTPIATLMGKVTK
ncbi:cytochrome b/b6 domain-containing protein [Arthrobacter sp. I3]|uniref:cytochrome b/b6 domain-containing protein n=1 Tax=Arthrobacter sp. I3 TaxID=218158 RepID=UPI0020A6B102|nr:cytochrome b/b6 domain-containing protein [Arthrobacter sp. I3]